MEMIVNHCQLAASAAARELLEPKYLKSCSAAVSCLGVMCYALGRGTALGATDATRRTLHQRLLSTF